MQEVHGYPARARQFFIVLLPILITQISLMAPGFFNTVMAGHISKEDLAGASSFPCSGLLWDSSRG